VLRRLLIGAAIALGATAIVWLLGFLPFVETIELKTYDWRMRTTAIPTAPSDQVVIVAIEDDSIRRLEPQVGRWPWPRLVHAAAIDFLARGPAKLVVYDGLFSERDMNRFTIGGENTPDGKVVGGEDWSGAESDQVFADAVAKAGNVILAASASAEGLIDASKTLATRVDGIPDHRFDIGDCAKEPRPMVLPPFPELAKAARGIGNTHMVLDADGPVRRFVPFVRTPDRVVPSLSVAAVLAAAGRGPDAVQAAPGDTLRIGDATVPMIRQMIATGDGFTIPVCRGLIPYRGPRDARTFTEYSFYDLFYSEQQLLAGEKPHLDPAVFKDRIVVIGATAPGLLDIFPSPFGLLTPGPVIHANVIDALLQQRTIAPMSSAAAVLIAAGAALGVGVTGAFGGAWVTAVVTGLVSGFLAWWSVSLFASGAWTPLVMPIGAAALTFVGDLGWKYFVEGREKRQVKRLFSRYVPKDVYNQLMADPTRAALGGKRRTMTVLFSDVRGFTAMSEKASPEEVVGQLNEYFSRMVDVLFEHRGTLDKFVGDMVMGLFGAPLDDPDHAEHAVQAGIAMTKALDELNDQWRAAGRPLLDIGIGISTGDMVAGNIGSSAIMSYTVIGDVVNLGARLESLNKDFGTRMIISEMTKDALKGRYDIRPLGEVTVKGKSRAVAIFEVKAL
jgi:adenylate cyclase